MFNEKVEPKETNKYYAMLINMLKSIKSVNASDLHIVPGSHPAVRLRAEIMLLSTFPVMTPNMTKKIAHILFQKQSSTDESIYEAGEVDLAFSVPDVGRFRVNVYKQTGAYSMAIRALPLDIRSFDQLGLPSAIKQLAYKSNGLVLVTGPTGSGKSTTLATLIDLINETSHSHIITIEDPIEYIYDNKLSIVSQREVGKDTKSFNDALRGALRQDPDVILVGEMRDAETISIALTAAETGHLVFSTLHTVGAAKTIDRIVDSFPADRQNQIRYQLATVLKGVVSQVLIPRKNEPGCVVATEVMLTNNAISNLIRENKPHQILNVLQTNVDKGMNSLDHCLEDLCRRDIITVEDAVAKCQNEATFIKNLSDLGVY